MATNPIEGKLEDKFNKMTDDEIKQWFDEISKSVTEEL